MTSLEGRFYFLKEKTNEESKWKSGKTDVS